MRKGPVQKKEKYGLIWNIVTPDICIEMEMVKMGGYHKRKDGTNSGHGLFYHFKEYLHILWPEIHWNIWSDLQVKCYLQYRIIGQLGPASTGKSFVSAACVLGDYYLYPECTTVLVSSTTKESLEMRVWGEIKKLHNLARSRYFWIPGHLIEGRQRIVTDPKNSNNEGRDFRNGIQGCPCKHGQQFQGIESYVGIKNKRLRQLADELQFMPRSFVDSIANLNKNTDFKCVGSGNPKDTTDALGVLCEPCAALGFWDGGVDQSPVTKTWPLKIPNGICIQLVGTDSPNLNGKLGIPLITQEQIDADIAFYGRDSLQFNMMDLGRMPRGLSQKRIITRNLCIKNRALEDPIWKDDRKWKIGCLDAAYRGVGGDRCVFAELDFGVGLDDEGKEFNQIALIDTALVPIVGGVDADPEDQIVNYVMPICNDRSIKPEHFFFDSTGRGSLMNAFARLWSPNIVGIEFGGRPSERMVSGDINTSCRDYYLNFVSEMWYRLRLVIESGQFRGMTEEVMMEACMREFGFVGGHKLQVEPKDKCKIRMGRSPDLVDAICAGLEGAIRLGFIIEKLSKGLKLPERDTRWKDEVKERALNLHRIGELLRT